MHRITGMARLFATATTGGLLLTACSTPATAPATSGSALRAKLPAAIRDAGVLKVAVNLGYAPMESKGPKGEPLGLDPDLADALTRYLGIRLQIVDTPFDKLIPGLQAKQYDVAMSAVSDNRQRREGTDDDGKQVNPGVDFVDYFIAGSSILVQKGNPDNVSTLEDLCGRTIAVQRGTTQAAIVDRETGVCAKSGHPLQVKATDTDDQALAEVAQGHAAADVNDYPVAASIVQQGRNGAQFQVAGAQLQPSPYGIAVTKDNTALRDVLDKALDQLIRHGDYGKVLAKWNLSDGAAQNAVVNGGF